MAPRLPCIDSGSISPATVLPTHAQRGSERFVVDYMMGSESGLDGSLHPALNTHDSSIEIDMDTHKWREVEREESFSFEALYKDVALEQKAFEKIIDDYQKTQKPKYRLPVPLSTPLDAEKYIAEILNSIAEGQKLYEDDAVRGFWGSIRKAFRKLGDNESAFVAWLGLLPVESNYISVLCGGLKLIIGAAARLRKLNKEIVGAICQIPQSLSKNRRLLSINKSSQQLRDYSSALYVAILRVMGHILEYYTQSALMKTMKVFVSQARFEAALTTKIDAIKECSKAIDEEAQICSYELGKNTNQILRSVANDIKVDCVNLVRLGENIEVHSKENNATSKVIIAGNAEIQQGQQRTEEKIDGMAGAITEALTGMKNVFMDFTQLKELMKEISVELQKQQESSASLPTEGISLNSIEVSQQPFFNLSSSPSREPSIVASQVTKKSLLSRLQQECITKAFSQTDIRSNLTHVFDLSLSDQDRAVYAMQAPPLQSFIDAHSSSILLINGQAPDVSTRRTPLSFLCAKFCDALRTTRKSQSPGSKKILCLSFFCGEHASASEEPLTGAAAVLNSLIGQLVGQYALFDFMLVKEKYVSSLDRDDVASLIKILSKLVSQLPDDVLVFCVLDELAEYDEGEGADEVENLVRALIRLVVRRKRKGKGCMFKLLLTAAVELRLAAVRDLDDTEVVNVPERLESQGGFTALQWDLSMGQGVEDLTLVN